MPPLRSTDDQVDVCRIVVLGLQKQRVRKIMAILAEPDLNATIKGVRVEYLPCVATFDSYIDEMENRIRYLASIDYLVDLVMEQSSSPNNKRPSSLLEIFDPDLSAHQDTTQKSKQPPLFEGISGVAIASAIEDEADVGRISEYFQTMMQSFSSPDVNSHIPIKCVEPNDGYKTMQEEIASYKAMDEEQKAKATKERILGPGKMAKFVSDFAHGIVQDALDERQKKQKEQEARLTKAAKESTPTSAEVLSPPPREIDPNKVRFLCHKCRSILFGQDDFQDPPHVPSQHHFGYRKHGISSGEQASLCQSHFLQEGLEWMGDMSDTEGKFSCPKCHTKLGTWNWSGAQCSCGTWVTPAIQIPKKKVDTLPPQGAALPSGTVVSPVILQQQTVLEL